MQDAAPLLSPPNQNQSRAPRFLLRAAIFTLFLWLARDLLIPVALGGVFTVLLEPSHRRLIEKLGPRSRGYTAVLLTVAALTLVILPLAMIGSEAAATVAEFFRANRHGTDDVERSALLGLLSILGGIQVGGCQFG